MEIRKNPPRKTVGIDRILSPADANTSYRIHRHDTTPDVDCVPDKQARVLVTGIGPRGAGNVQVLSKTVTGSACYEVISGLTDEKCCDVTGFFDELMSSDLLVVITAFDDRSLDPFFHSLCKAAHEMDIPTVCVTCQPDMMTSHAPGLTGSAEPLPDIVFYLSGHALQGPCDLLPEQPAQRYALSGYAKRHLAASVSRLITQTGVACIDSGDVVSLLRSGRRGFMGVGVGSGEASGRTAAMLAVERLHRQGMNTAGCRGALVCVYGSSLMGMDDFDDAVRVVQGFFAADAAIISGILVDEYLGQSARVTLLAVV